MQPVPWSSKTGERGAVAKLQEFLESRALGEAFMRKFERCTRRMRRVCGVIAAA